MGWTPTSGINGTDLIVTLIPIRLAIRFVLDSDWLIILDLAKFRQNTLSVMCCYELERPWPYSGNVQPQHKKMSRWVMIPHHYHDPYRPNDNEPERQPNEHNRLGPELKLSEYISHTYDIIDMLVIGVHQLGNYCHPIKHGNEMAVRFPKNWYWTNILKGPL